MVWAATALPSLGQGGTPLAFHPFFYCLQSIHYSLSWSRRRPNGTARYADPTAQTGTDAPEQPRKMPGAIARPSAERCISLLGLLPYSERFMLKAARFFLSFSRLHERLKKNVTDLCSKNFLAKIRKNSLAYAMQYPSQLSSVILGSGELTGRKGTDEAMATQRPPPSGRRPLSAIRIRS